MNQPDGTRTVISKQFKFEAAHQLIRVDYSDQENRDKFGKCSYLHGHSYTVSVEVTGKINTEGMVLNYYRIGDIMDPIVERLDHAFLNDVISGLTTAENIAAFIWAACRTQFLNLSVVLLAIQVKETERTFARVELGGPRT